MVGVGEGVKVGVDVGVAVLVDVGVGVKVLVGVGGGVKVGGDGTVGLQNKHKRLLRVLLVLMTEFVLERPTPIRPPEPIRPTYPEDSATTTTIVIKTGSSHLRLS